MKKDLKKKINTFILHHLRILQINPSNYITDMSIKHFSWKI